MSFYPNECFVCKETSSLKRCSRCNMISYCGEPHQKKDWKIHKTVCKIISALLKERRLSHIYENLKGVDQKRWTDEREKLRREVETKLRRPLALEQIEMLRYPRVCFDCHDARQDLLKNCPNCPLASFCKDHPSNSEHDKNCYLIKQSHDMETGIDPTDEIVSVTVLTVVGFTPMEKSAKPPTSMKAYLDQNLRPEYRLPVNVKYYISECLSIPLTIYNAFRKLNQPVNSEMVIHVQGIGNLYAYTNSWESLLHLLPDMNSLTVVLTEQDEYLRKNLRVCNKCLFKRKNLVIEGISMPYMQYFREKFYKTPNMFAVFNINPPEKEDMQGMGMWNTVLVYWGQLSCPIVLATSKERKMKFIIDSMRPTFWNSLICYNGENEFAPMYPTRDWEKWGVCKSYEFLIVARAPESPSNAESLEFEAKVPCFNQQLLEKSFEDNHEENASSSVEAKREVWRKFFFASMCQVCRTANASVTCKRCKMIFYCGENHRKVHWPEHKNICKVILGLLNETEAPNLFDKLKTEDGELWLKAKIDLLKKAELKIKRKLSDEEREIFLFPKTCFACHESDLSVLRNCECGISFCKSHKDNSSHKELCKEFSMSRKLIMFGDPPVMAAKFKVIPKKKRYTLPSSMASFIDIYLKSKEKALPLQQFDVPNLQNILLSDSLTRALTFIYCADRLLDPIYTEESDSLVVHVIGSTKREISEVNFWRLVLFWLEHLKNLTIIFIGPEIEVPCLPSYLSAELDFSGVCYASNQNLKIEAHALRYEDYYRSDVFVRPDIVVGFNLNIHECELGISECTWQDTILILNELEVPFIVTSGSKARARKDDKRYSTLFGNSAYVSSSDENPFASLIPERDFETEGLRYSNKYIHVYITYSPENPKIVGVIPKSQEEIKRRLEELEKSVEESRLKICKMMHFSEEGTPLMETVKAVKAKKFKSENTAEIKVEAEKTEMEKSVKDEIHKCEIEPETETKESEKKSPETEKPECEAESEIKKNEPEATPLNEEIKLKVENNDLLKENLLLKEENKILMENVLLKEENEQLRNENQKLRQLNEKLREENESIKDIRKEIQDSIRAVMNDKS